MGKAIEFSKTTREVTGSSLKPTAPRSQAGVQHQVTPDHQRDTACIKLHTPAISSFNLASVQRALEFTCFPPHPRSAVVGTVQKMQFACELGWLLLLPLGRFFQFERKCQIKGLLSFFRAPSCQTPKRS